MIRLHRWVAGLIIFLAMAVMLCPASVAGGLDQGGEWTYDLYLAGNKAGTCTVVSTPARDGALETRASVKFEVNQGGQKIQVALDSRTTYAWPGAHPRSYEVKITPSAGPEALIAAQFGEKESTVTVEAAGQKIPTKIETTGDEYLLDNNFIVVHYWAMLSSLNPREGEAMAVKFIVPQIVPRMSKALDMTLSKAGVETIKVGGVEHKALKLTSQGNGLTMDFWLDPDDRTLLRWTVPAQQSEVILAASKPTETTPAQPKEITAAPAEGNEITVAPSILQQYVGTYEIAPKFNLMITLEGNQLMAQASGQGKAPVFASSETKFFYKVVDAQIEFFKNDKGAIAHLVLYQNNKEMKAPRISDTVVVRKEITVSPAILAQYVGTYELQPGFDLVVTLEGDQLMTQATGQGKIPIFAMSETKFFPKVMDGEIEFLKDDTGAVTHLMLHQGPAEIKAPRK